MFGVNHSNNYLSDILGNAMLFHEVHQAGFEHQIGKNIFIHLDFNNYSALALKNYPTNDHILVTQEVDFIFRKNFCRTILKKFSAVLTFNDELAELPNVSKIGCIQGFSLTERPINEILFRDKKFACAVVANKFGFLRGCQFWYRRDVLEKMTLSAHERAVAFDVFGYGWSKFPSCPTFFESAVAALIPPPRINYKGSCLDKFDILGQYKFVVVIENKRVPGYITEKIFDCFLSGVVPIYRGAPNVLKYIPRDCCVWLDDFSSVESLIDYLLNMPFQKYDQMVKAATVFVSDPNNIFFDGRYPSLLSKVIRRVSERD